VNSNPNYTGRDQNQHSTVSHKTSLQQCKSTHKTLKFKHEKTMDNVCTSDSCAHFQWYALNSLSCKCSVNQPTCILVSCR